MDKLVLIYKPTDCKSARDAFQSDSGIGNDENEAEGSRPIKKALIALHARAPPPPPSPPPAPPHQMSEAPDEAAAEEDSGEDEEIIEEIDA